MGNTSHDVNLLAADGRTFSAYMAQPSLVPAPGIVVLQEIFGVNAFVRRVVDKLAQSGFVAVAPDLYWRQEPRVQLDYTETDLDRARKFMKNLDERLAIQDGVAALDFLRGRQDICTGKVAALGYCLGGKLAYLMATRSNVDAAVSYYGTGIHAVLGEASNLRAPLLLHIAAADHLCPPEAQKQIVEGLKPYASRNVEVCVYEGVGHGFARDGGATYNPAATALADTRTTKFLNTHLQKL
jgi:carboxymethylenebutenolidase